MKSSIFKAVMMQTVKPGMFSSHLHSPSKTKILIALTQVLTAISKIQVGEKKRKNNNNNKKNPSVF